MRLSTPFVLSFVTVALAGTCCPFPEACEDDADCPTGEHCTAGSCVQCVTNAQCPALLPVCDTTSHTCVCSPNLDCGGEPGRAP